MNRYEVIKKLRNTKMPRGYEIRNNMNIQLSYEIRKKYEYTKTILN